MVLVGVITVVLLDPLMLDSFLGGGHWWHHFSSSSFAAAKTPNEDGIVGATLLHSTNEGKFHRRYPNSLLTLFFPFTLF
jgi:hypothetical protein